MKILQFYEHWNLTLNRRNGRILDQNVMYDDVWPSTVRQSIIMRWSKKRKRENISFVYGFIISRSCTLHGSEKHVLYCSPLELEFSPIFFMFNATWAISLCLFDFSGMDFFYWLINFVLGVINKPHFLLLFPDLKTEMCYTELLLCSNTPNHKYIKGKVYHIISFC